MEAVAALLLFLQAEEPPQRHPVLEALGYLIAHQGTDGSWGGSPSGCSCRKPAPGGDLESTAWVILAFAGAGYTELSRDDYNGARFGQVVRSGLEWLVCRQDKEGAFDRDDPAANALAALALTETYGMTVLRKEAAEKAYAWVEKCRNKDVVGRIRQGMVIGSGKLSEIGDSHDARLLALADELAKEQGDLARWGSLFLRGFTEQGRRDKPPTEFQRGDLLRFPAETLNIFASATFWGDVEEWHNWFRRLKDVLVPLQQDGKRTCEAGSWDGSSLRERVRTTAIRCLTLQHYRCWYCRNVFRKSK